MTVETKICDICGQEGARTQRLTRTYGEGSELLIIENVPVISCPHCGESYMESSTLHEIDRIRLHREAFAEVRPVDVASYG